MESRTEKQTDRWQTYIQTDENACLLRENGHFDRESDGKMDRKID